MRGCDELDRGRTFIRLNNRDTAMVIGLLKNCFLNRHLNMLGEMVLTNYSRENEASSQLLNECSGYEDIRWEVFGDVEPSYKAVRSLEIPDPMRLAKVEGKFCRRSGLVYSYNLCCLHAEK